MFEDCLIIKALPKTFCINKSVNGRAFALDLGSLIEKHCWNSLVFNRTKRLIIANAIHIFTTQVIVLLVEVISKLQFTAKLSNRKEVAFRMIRKHWN